MGRTVDLREMLHQTSEIVDNTDAGGIKWKITHPIDGKFSISTGVLALNMESYAQMIIRVTRVLDDLVHNEGKEFI